jgi:hypothetical protein
VAIKIESDPVGLADDQKVKTCSSMKAEKKPELAIFASPGLNLRS